jgi:hypothetical protein
MRDTAQRLAEAGIILRSGAANGADTAFEQGCVSASGPSEIWLPWKGFNGHADTGLYPEAKHFEIASTLHPAWAALSHGPKALHARNVGQVLGADCATPVAFVLCWTPDGCEQEATRTRKTGGTGTAISLAARHGIPVINLLNESAQEQLEAMVNELLNTPYPDIYEPDDNPEAKYDFGL